MLITLTPVDGVEPKHPQSYRDEYVFRYNRCKTPMAAFQNVLGISAQKKPGTLHEPMLPEVKVISIYLYLLAYYKTSMTDFNLGTCIINTGKGLSRAQD